MFGIADLRNSGPNHCWYDNACTLQSIRDENTFKNFFFVTNTLKPADVKLNPTTCYLALKL